MILLLIFFILICIVFVKIVFKLISSSSKKANRFSDNYQEDIRTQAIVKSINDGKDNKNKESEEVNHLNIQANNNKYGTIIWTTITFLLIAFFVILFIIYSN